MHYWALDNQKRLKKHIELANGVPSDDILRRVFRFLDYDAFSKCFIDFTQNLCELTNGEVVVFDGIDNSAVNTAFLRRIAMNLGNSVNSRFSLFQRLKSLEKKQVT